MSLSSEITRLMSAKADLKSAIEGKGVPVPSATKLDGYASLVGSITGGGTPTLQSKSVAFTPAETIQTSTVTADSGYDGLSTVNVSVDAIPSAYVIPSGSLSISANGTYNVEAFARAEVMVSGGGGSDQWAGRIDGTISEAIDYQGSFTTLGYYAFAECSQLTTASFPNVSYIGQRAFHYCSRLTTASFPNASHIDSYAFLSCGLTTAYFPNVLSVEESAFYGCTSLTTASFPNVSSITNNAFYNCLRLTTISFPKASYIGNYTFYGCTSLTTVNFSNVSYIGSSAFASCYSLTTVTMPNASYIGSYAFYRCSYLTTASFPNVSYIGNSAFYYCYGLTAVSFPNASYIGSNAFFYCFNLKTASFSNALSIGSNAFVTCYSLNTVIFNNLSSISGIIYASAFYCDYNLLSIYLLASTIYGLSNVNVFASTPISTYTTSTGGVQGSIFVPESLYSTYKSSTNWATYADRFASLTDAQISNVLTYGTHNPT